jgi:DNA adenine methylase
MKTPISYYGGKQNLLKEILPRIPAHNLYCEPFCGGAAVFFAKEKSNVEVINDTNFELINFYRVLQQDLYALQMMVKISLHSRRMYSDARVVYDNPHMFDPIKRAWAVWILSSQSFSAMLDGSWGYDVAKNTTTKKITNKKESFTEDLSIRLQDVQIECTDALRIINSRDRSDSFFYIDPPYFNSDCGHYDGYSIDDFKTLLTLLKSIQGKFMLSSYDSSILRDFVKENKWNQVFIEQKVSVNGMGKRKSKVEVITINYSNC